MKQREENPEPRNQIPLMAPDMQMQVQQTINEHPEIDTMDDVARAEIIDITDWRVNGGVEKPWGRKARNNDPNNPNLNTDGMTYLRPDGLFEIYDCISGIDGQSSWEGYGPYAPGENGYWWPPQPVENQPPAPPSENYDQQIADLTYRIENLEGQIEAQASEIDKINQILVNGLHTHGPVDLPIVLESLTRLRAKGDINVAVKLGPAEEQSFDVESGEEVNVDTVRRLFDER